MDALAPAAFPPFAPSGFRLAAPDEVPDGSALVGRAVFSRWPADGWVRGTVVRRSRAAGFSHVVRYGPRSALGAAVAASLLDSLLDAASHGPARPVAGSCSGYARPARAIPLSL